MRLPTQRSALVLRRFQGVALGRPLSGAILVLLLLLSLLSELPREQASLTSPLSRGIEFATVPFTSARSFLFDGYQKLLPRVPQAQPVTIVAIDEKSLTEVGQWPWPRNKLAALLDAINRHQPAAIGLDIYMPEADQSSPAKVAENLSAGRSDLIAALKAMPSNDAILAQALRKSPSVLGAAGFDFKTFGTSEGMHSVPLVLQGADPLPYVLKYTSVLVSLPELQVAAKGQALLNVDTKEGGVVRRIPLLAAVGEQLIPGMAMEMLRVATGSSAITVQTGGHGVDTVQVADLSVPTQPPGDVWVHYARQASGANRYVSAQNVLLGRVDPEMLAGTLVRIGLVGAGLNDMRTTALNEVVPGTEILAQLIESLFDGEFLIRPWWMKWLETVLMAMIGFAIIWVLPHTDSRLAALLRNRPKRSLGLILVFDLLVLIIGLLIFRFYGVLFDASSFILVFSLFMGSLVSAALIDGMSQARIKLTRLVDNGILLGQAHDLNKLLKQTLESAKEMANCQAISLLLKTEADTLILAMRSGDGLLADFSLPLLNAKGLPNRQFLSVDAVTGGETIGVSNIALAANYETGFDSEFGITPELNAVSALAVPMMAGEGNVMGVILLVNALDAPNGEVIAFSPETFGFLEALAAQAAVAIENRNLLETQKALTDSTIKILSGAIDAKSAYTGGHCERVPELAFMLAEKACAAQEGPLAEFDFKTEDEWREFRIGAWLHDCGKVTTPEYVVDKSTKLETIYNRIHEVRLRFEVLLRDAQVERLQAIVDNPLMAEEADARFARRKAELINDYAFVAECNIGGEYMAPDRIDRLKRIALNTWWRNFDDRLGLSHEELRRHEREAYEPLPAKENLLSDKVHHLFERPPSKALDVKYGFKLYVPHYLYNHGEMHNLSVSRGTLTEEERFKINEHIIQTIVMLEQMPLPPNLRRVPEYAGTHHETLDGKGYPRKLVAAELSVPARIMAIADIFEALSASDRPYKKGKSLSECIKIMSFFKKDQHIDPVLFDLFLTSGVYKTYAERYLKPEQIDDVDIELYVSA